MAFTPSEPGYYIFEINAYENNECHLLCAASGNLYKNDQGIGGCDTSGHWSNVELVSGMMELLKLMIVLRKMNIVPMVLPKNQA